MAAFVLSYRLLAAIRWSELAGRMAAAQRGLLVLAALALAARFAAWDWRFRQAAGRAGGLRTGPLLGFFSLHASAALNLLTPAARVLGGLVRARHFARAAHRPVALLYGVVLYDQLAHHAVMMALTGLATLAMIAGGSVGATGSIGAGMAGRWGWLAAAATLAGLTALALAALVRARRRRRGGAGAGLGSGSGLLARWARRWERRAEQPRFPRALGRLYVDGRQAAAVCGALLRDRTLLAPAAIGGAGYFLLNAAAQWLVFAALGERVDPLVVIAVVALGNAAGVFTGTPGGVGTTEAAMVPLFVLLGMAPAAAAAGTLIFRGLHYAVVLALGLPALAWLELRTGQRERRERAAAGNQQAS